MKTLIFVLFSVTLFAQTPRPDTLYIINGKSFPCLVTNINEDKIEFDYAKYSHESTVLLAVDKLSLEKYGIVYSNKNGFTKNIDEIKGYVNKRFEKVERERLEKQKKEKQQRLAKLEQERIEKDKNNPAVESLPEQNNFDDEVTVSNFSTLRNKWSFGVLYVPYYSGKVYEVINNSNYQYPTVNNYSVNSTNMEAQLTYAANRKLRLSLDLSYTAASTENRSETHSRNQSSNNQYDSGSERKNSLTLLDFNVGIKYYFQEMEPQKVSVYALASLGKQFAFADYKYKNLFPTNQDGTITENNEKEFMEDLNSPFHFNLGFGAEYYFNNSLSLTANIKFIYSRVSAKSDSRTISQTSIDTYTYEYKTSDVNTKIGLGLNFYF